MSRLTSFQIVLVVVLGVSSPPVKETIARSNDAAREGKPIQLFNGRDLANWYVYTTATQFENPGVFQVVDGMLYVPGGKDDVAYFGGLITRADYENYRLRFDYKWGKNTYGNRKDRARDAGVLLHCIGPNEPGPWMGSFEYQIIEGGVGDMLVVALNHRADTDNPPRLTCAATAEIRRKEPYFKPNGDHCVVNEGDRLNWWGRDPDWQDKIGFRGQDDVESPFGEWTRCEIVAQDNHLQFYVNGQLVNQAQELSNSKGKILLQTEGAEVWYRNIELTPLDDNRLDEADQKAGNAGS